MVTVSAPNIGAPQTKGTAAAYHRERWPILIINGHELLALSRSGAIVQGPAVRDRNTSFIR